jgi:hypothetical protein
MYKKIVHSIQEEHFDHPMVLPKHISNVKKVSMDTRLPLPDFVMTEATMLFRMDSRTLWSKYVWGLINYGISMNNKIPGTEQVQARLVKNANALGEYITPYYGIASGNKFSNLLVSFSTIGAQVVDAVKDKRTIEGIPELWAQIIDNIATFMHELNPDNWPKAVVTDYFNNIVAYWVREITSRAAMDWSVNEVAIDSLSKLVITGLGYSGSTFGSLADFFSRGIIAQFPLKFVA